ncbi:hypothetical protein CH365_19425 [Leptospira neocaledonica]|uniref:Uncharacterized protein n=1 Tax=Leptospira neocaledonica TaxID=2023192 RepID=A0A2M9ZTP6_9LEPT|nr:hypothetical protein CH365_19425 [Leptospira neocaledonica]
MSTPKDPTKDFFVVSVLISNVSSEKFVFAPAASLEFGGGESKLPSLPAFVEYCCNFFEVQAGYFKSSFLQRYAFDDISIEPGESILREFSFLYSRDARPKIILMFEKGDEKVKVRNLGSIEIASSD